MMAFVCLVLGLWGVYDLVITIPRDIEYSARHKFLVESVQPAMDSPLGSIERGDALIHLQERILESDGLDQEWFNSMELFAQAIDGGNKLIQRDAKAVLATDSTKYEVVEPSKFDWYMQWVFAICIPFALYYFYMYLKMKSKASLYSYENDGTLSTPEGTWSSEEIIDIDMSRWIAKTGNARSTWTAKAVVSPDTKILLDDYMFTDMHLIIGALAHRFYPEDWTPLAKRVKVESVDEGIDELSRQQEEE
jgi:hypothetical protein